MKKIIFSLALLVASSTAFVSFAQDNTSTAKKTECCETQKGDKKGKRDIKDLKKGKIKPVMKAPNLFEGITLTAEQQTKLDELNASMRPQRPEKKEGDQKLTDEQKKELKKEMNSKRGERKKKYLEGVKSILTPQQYTQFLENSYLNGGMKLQKPQSFKPGKKDFKGNKEFAKDRRKGNKEKTQG